MTIGTEQFLAFPLTLAYYVYLISAYVLTPMIISTFPQPWKTAVALASTLCQPLICLGVCLLSPQASQTWTPLAVESMMAVSYLTSVTFGHWSTGLTGIIPAIGVVTFGGLIYVTIVDLSFRTTFVRHGQRRFLTQLSALDRLRFLSRGALRGLGTMFGGMSVRFRSLMGKDFGEGVTEGSALDVVSWPEGNLVRDIPPPYSPRHSLFPHTHTQV